MPATRHHAYQGHEWVQDSLELLSSARARGVCEGISQWIDRPAPSRDASCDVSVLAAAPGDAGPRSDASRERRQGRPHRDVPLLGPASARKGDEPGGTSS